MVDVTPLLQQIDDEYVIFGTGEDMDLEFSAAAQPALPAHWVRDYFFYANGFVKDMDFYEVSPFTVDAMPFHAMSSYPYQSKEPIQTTQSTSPTNWSGTIASSRALLLVGTISTIYRPSRHPLQPKQELLDDRHCSAFRCRNVRYAPCSEDISS